MGKLRGMRFYGAGPMDRAPDGGKNWREWITPKLHELGITFINPCNKPINIGSETIEDRQYRQELLEQLRYDEFSREMKTLRVVDLRCVDISDALIVYFDTEQFMCGTMEEIFLANRQKKPILLYCPRGINQIYHWMWGVLPSQMFFEKWDDLFSYLNDIDSGKNTEHLKRWMWFDYDKLTPPIPKGDTK